jgi:predicted alpha/beta hydrolase family esterase
MRRLFIIHGYTGYPNKNWFPWLKTEAEKLGMNVTVPAMPNTEAPQLNEWLPYLQEIVGKPNEDTYFVGHSLGCSTILRYLESLSEGQRVGGAILVAGFAEPIHFTELDSFTTSAWDDEKIKQATRKLVVINSDNDPHVPTEMAEHIHQRFGAKLIIIPDAGHINESSGYKEAPFVLDELKSFL